MADYTPTIENVRGAYVFLADRPDQSEARAEFNRMLAKVRAEAWDQGWVSAMQYEGRCQDAEAAGQGVFITKPRNPYRTTESED